MNNIKIKKIGLEYLFKEKILIVKNNKNKYDGEDVILIKNTNKHIIFFSLPRKEYVNVDRKSGYVNTIAINNTFNQTINTFKTINLNNIFKNVYFYGYHKRIIILPTEGFGFVHDNKTFETQKYNIISINYNNTNNLITSIDLDNRVIYLYYYNKYDKIITINIQNYTQKNILNFVIVYNENNLELIYGNKTYKNIIKIKDTSNYIIFYSFDFNKYIKIIKRKGDMLLGDYNYNHSIFTPSLS